MVAGVAAASSNNSIGVASICWGCMIMPVRVSDSSGGATASNIATGINWAADHGARVVNVAYQVTGNSTLSLAAQYLWGKGGILTAPAGDYGIAYSNSDNPYVLEVGSTDNNDVIYSWSNTGNFVDLVAPGCAMTTYQFNSYQSGCGTSMSSPMVAGVIGLMLSVKSSLTPTQITSMLQQSVNDLGAAGRDPVYGWGR